MVLGAPGDATHLLRALLDGGFAPGEACFGYLLDPAAAAAAHRAGIGATLEVALGGRHAPEMCGAPVEASARVAALSDGRWALDAFTAGVPVDLGPMALLRVRGVDVLVCSVAAQVRSSRQG